MVSRDALRDLRTVGQIELKAQQDAHDLRYIDEFEEKLAGVSEMLEKRLRVAARMGYLELKLIAVDSPALIDINKVCCTDPSRRDDRGRNWATVNPYHDKSVVRNAALLGVWKRLESMSLQPIFIEGPYGKPIFSVQLPDGGIYPRKDLAKDAAGRTMNRMDECLNEDGTISFTPAPTTLRGGA